MKIIGTRRSTLRILFFAVIPLCLFACSSVNKKTSTGAFDPAAAFQKADDQINRGYYEEARKTLEDIVANDMSQQNAILAKLRIADTYFEDESYEEAAAEYIAFLDSYPGHKHASYSQYKLAMSFFKKIKTADVSYEVAQRALLEFEKLRKNYPRNPYMDVTESRIKTCQRVLAEYEFYVGSFYFKKNSFEAAVQRLNALLQNYPDSARESEALYYLGLSYKNMGQKDKAVSALTTLVEKFPTTKIAGDAKALIASLQ